MARQEEMLLNAAAKAASQETIGSFLNSLPNYLLQQQQYKDKVDTASMTISDASDFIQTFQDLIEKNKNTPVNLDDAPPF